jgi:hypothetical protein
VSETRDRLEHLLDGYGVNAPTDIPTLLRDAVAAMTSATVDVSLGRLDSACSARGFWGSYSALAPPSRRVWPPGPSRICSRTFASSTMSWPATRAHRLQPLDPTIVTRYMPQGPKPTASARDRRERPARTTLADTCEPFGTSWLVCGQLVHGRAVDPGVIRAGDMSYHDSVQWEPPCRTRVRTIFQPTSAAGQVRQRGVSPQRHP